MRSNMYKTSNDYAQYVVTEESPLLEHLMETLNDSRTKIKAILQGRGIKVNGKIVTQYNFPLKPGMKISVSRRKENNTFKSKYLKIVYEETVLDDYLHKGRQKCSIHVVHRLDRDTSGLMIYAKDYETEQILEHNWHNIVYDRRYVAVVSGEIVEDGGTISSWLKDNKAYITYSSQTDNGGKFAVTHFNVLARTTEHTLVEFKLETGRKNQIRVHSADIGHPICGDTKYGNGDNPLPRLCLHAYILCFYHPVTGERLEFETPIPASFNKLFK